MQEILLTAAVSIPIMWLNFSTFVHPILSASRPVLAINVFMTKKVGKLVPELALNIAHASTGTHLYSSALSPQRVLHNVQLDTRDAQHALDPSSMRNP